MVKQLKVLFVFLLVIVSLDFFYARFLPKSIILYFWFVYIAFSVIVSLPHIFLKRRGFVLPVQLMFLSMLICIFMANASWGQSLVNSILSTVPYMLWILFFYLLEAKIPIKTIENIILTYGIIYIILYLYQFTHASTPLFGFKDEFTEDRGIIRIIFPGGGIFYLSSFMALNKLTTQRNKKWLWLLLSTLGIVCTVMQVTRQAIFAVLLIYVYHLIKFFAIQYRLLVILCFALGLYFVVNSSNPVIKGITEQQKNDSQEGKEYIRVVAGTYFLQEFSPTGISRVLGNGVPYSTEYYALFVKKLEDLGFFLSDVGIIAMYVMFGILSVIAYIFIWFKSFTIPVPKKFYYVKYYLWYLLITCLTSDCVYGTDYLIATVFALYIYQTIYEEENELPIKKSRVFFKRV